MSGLAKAIPKLIEYLPQIIEAIFKAFTEIDWAELGKSIINGLVSGLKALGNLIWDTLKGIAQSALNGFKKMFGIASPSKLFEGFGKNIDEGLSIGISTNADDVEDSMMGLRNTADTMLNGNYDYNLKSLAQNSAFGKNLVSTNNYNTKNTEIKIIIEKVINNRKEDIKQLVDEITYYIKKNELAGGKT